MHRTTQIALGAALVVGASLLAWLAWPRPTDPSSGEREVRVAAASDLKFALEEVVAGFGRERPDVVVKVTYGASGTFFSQLSNRAPFDVFLSADVDYPRKLIEQGFAEADSEFLYAVGHLVLWVPKSSPLDLEKDGVQALLSPSIKKIAVANPRHAPYGRAAMAALESLGVLDAVRDKLVYGENVAQAAQFVHGGAADAGIVALSLALAPSMRGQGRYWKVPLTAHPRLEQGGVVLSWAQDRASANAFRAYLLSSDGKAILKRYGFVLPGE